MVTTLSTAEVATLDPNMVFREHSIREIDVFAKQLEQEAKQKQQAAQSLVAQNFHDLLRIAGTVDDMQKHLHALHTVLQSLQTTTQHTSELCMRLRTPTTSTSNADATPSTQSAAAMLLVAEAPEYVRSSLASQSMLGAVWALVFATKAHTWLETHSPDVLTRFPLLASQWDALEAQREWVMTHIQARWHDISLPTQQLLDAVLAWTFYTPTTLAEALAQFYARRVEAISRLCTSTDIPLPQRMAAIVRAITTTLHQATRLWGPDGALMRAMQTFAQSPRYWYDYGRPRTRSTYTPLSSPLFEHAPPDVTTYEPPSCPPLSLDTPTHRLGEQVCEEVEALTQALASVTDTDTLHACRAAMEAGMPAALPPTLAMVQARLQALLETRMHALRQHTLTDVTMAFSQALGRALDEVHDANALPYLFPISSGYVAPSHWRTYRPSHVDACVRLVETRLSRLSLREMHVQRAWQATWTALLRQLQQADATSLAQVQLLMQLCTALYTSNVLATGDDRTSYQASLANLYTQLATRWIDRILAQATSSQTRLAGVLWHIAHAIPAIGPSPFPMPMQHVADALERAFPATSRTSTETAMYKALQSAKDGALRAPGRWRSALAPWATHSPSPSTPPMLVRVAPRFSM